MDKIFQKYFLDNPVFRYVAILICINKIFQNQLQKYPLLRQAVPNLSTKSLRNTCEEIYILESCSVPMNKIFQIHL